MAAPGDGGWEPTAQQAEWERWAWQQWEAQQDPSAAAHYAAQQQQQQQYDQQPPQQYGGQPGHPNGNGFGGWQQPGGGYDGAAAGWRPSLPGVDDESSRRPPPAKRQRHDTPLQPDQHAMFLSARGGGDGGGSRGGATPTSAPPPSGKAARRAANAAAAATGDYLDQYPAVKQLIRRFKAELRVDQFPLQLLNEYATRLMYQVVWAVEQESRMGGFRVEVRLASKRDGETIEAAAGRARNKQAGKQVASAALLQKMLDEGTIDEESMLNPGTGSKDKKNWQTPQRPGLGAPADTPGSGGRFGGGRFSGGRHGGGRYGSPYGRFGGFSPLGRVGASPFVRGGVMVPAGAGFELQPTPGSAGTQARLDAASKPYRPPSLAEQINSFAAAALPNAAKQFTPTGAVRRASQHGGANGSGGGGGGAALQSNSGAEGSRGLGWAGAEVPEPGEVPPQLPAGTTGAA
ncbi:hypothetical protein C2E20_8588 [Micractinium conductrix]|uniref:DRBM domain-containing protein n=1 Tax=Micractinium conductrix TaxID=554055 RepID=A0A2P6V135_9CHLO|nr:hypothetical protein C2E20_8588 [Micractinium conductrix]|eukprot:PSC67802.1 hypothetical protein C2E20_8588 [Micractinium conductrix]